MFVRFAVVQTYDNSQRGLGVFQALYRVRDEGKFYPYEEEHFRTVSE